MQADITANLGHHSVPAYQALRESGKNRLGQASMSLRLVCVSGYWKKGVSMYIQHGWSLLCKQTLITAQALGPSGTPVKPGWLLTS